ncbi:MAG: TolC family protein [Spirochaetales bacterium]|nr:TolC family protein [Spirochaetales bacterium]
MAKRFFPLICLLASGWLYGETPGDAIDIALDNSALLHAAESEILAAESDLKGAKRDLLPELGVSASYQYNSADSEINLPTGSINMVQNHNVDFSGTVQWAVFTGFARKAAIEMNSIAVEIARAGYLSREIQTAIETLVYYRQVQSAKLQIDSLQSGSERLSLQMKQLEDLNRQGMASDADLISLRLSLLEYDQQIIQAESELDKARSGLFEKTGRVITVIDAPSDLSDIALPGFLPENIPSLSIYALNKEVAESRSELERASLYPSVAVNSAVHYGLPGANPVDNDWMFYFTASARLSWLTDWGASSARARAAESRGESAERSGAAALSQAKLQFDRDSRELQASLTQLEFLKEASRLTGEKSAIIEKQYEQGMATITDYTDATLAGTLSDLRYKTQLLTVLLKLNRLEAVNGKPLDRWSMIK